MFTGIAGGLLVFTGVWHATEWMMDGRRRDTWLLVPVGLMYLLLGALIVMSVGGWVVQLISVLAVAAGATTAFLRRGQMQIRGWVLWVFIVIDVLIILALTAGLLA